MMATITQHAGLLLALVLACGAAAAPDDALIGLTYK